MADNIKAPEEQKEVKAPEQVKSLFAPEAIEQLESVISKLEKAHELADALSGKINPAKAQIAVRDGFKLPVYHKFAVTLVKGAKEPYDDKSFEKGKQLTEKPVAKNERDIETLNAQSYLSGHRYYKA